MSARPIKPERPEGRENPAYFKRWGKTIMVPLKQQIYVTEGTVTVSKREEDPGDGTMRVGGCGVAMFQREM